MKQRSIPSAAYNLKYYYPPLWQIFILKYANFQDIIDSSENAKKHIYILEKSKLEHFETS